MTTPVSHHHWVQPSSGLRPWVACYLITTNDRGNSIELPRVHVPPLTGAILQIHVGAQPLIDDGFEGWQRTPRVALAGPQTAARVQINDGPPALTVTVCFQPEGWHQIIRDEPSTLGNAFVAAGDLMDGQADELASRLVGTEANGLIAVLEDWLWQRIRQAAAPSIEARWLRKRLATGSLKELANEMGISNRQLTRRTRRVLGIPPKEYQRVARLHRLGQLQGVPLGPSQRAPSGADVAAAMDYYDQSHLARDIRDLTGLTPRQLMMQAPELGLYHQPPPVPLF